MLRAALDQRAQPLRMAQVEHAHAAARDLVLVRRTNPAARRPDRLAGCALLVQQLVVGEHQVRAIADVEAPLDVHAVAHELVDLGEQRLGVEHDAVADRAPHARVQDAARNLVEHGRAVADVHGVAGVRAALVAHHPVGALGQDVDELALPFIAPLRADDDDRAGLGNRTSRRYAAMALRPLTSPVTRARPAASRSSSGPRTGPP